MIAVEVRELPRVIRYAIIHCSMADMRVGDNRYHYYITKDGCVHQCLALSSIGHHTHGFDRCSIGVCYEGGRDADGHSKDTRTLPQRCALHDLISLLRRVFSGIKVLGHNQLSAYERLNRCPCFDFGQEAPYSQI